MTHMEPALPPSDVAYLRELEARIRLLERRQPVLSFPLPVVAIFGNPEIQGFYSHSQTAVSDVWRVDGYVTAPILDYDLSTSDAFATTNPTTLTLEIELRSYDGSFSNTVILSDTSAPDTQVAGYVNLLDATPLDEDIMGRFVSFRIGIGRSGGSGDAAAVRLNKPFLLRVRD